MVSGDNTKRITLHRRREIKPENDSFSCVPFCLRSLNYGKYVGLLNGFKEFAGTHIAFSPIIFICGKMKYKIKPVVVTPSVIRQVGEDDEGLYLCEAENGVSDPLGKLVGLKINSK